MQSSNNFKIINKFKEIIWDLEIYKNINIKSKHEKNILLIRKYDKENSEELIIFIRRHRLFFTILNNEVFK